MLYRVRTFVTSGFFVYNWPIIADFEWNYIDVDWMNTDWYPDNQMLYQRYPTAPWKTAKSHREIQEEISDGKHDLNHIPIQRNRTSYIHNITLDDLSVYNWTLKRWENLHDHNRWKLEVRHDEDNRDYGFRLYMLDPEVADHNFRLYWNKIPETQMRNAKLKRNALLDISTVITEEVRNPARNLRVNTGRHLRIRKLFPYEQKESFSIGKFDDGYRYEMNFHIAKYMHFKNQLQLQDVKLYNKTLGRFEDLLNPQSFEVRFKDEKLVSGGYETNTRIVDSIISQSGEGFTNGPVWGWNQAYGVHIFGEIEAELANGFITKFTPTHCPNPPTEDVSLEFHLYQHHSQSQAQMGVVMVDFKTERIEARHDGYIHNVTNRMAPLPEHFKIICKLDLPKPHDYDVIISKTQKRHTFIDHRWILTPTIHLPGVNVNHNSIYLMTDRGRFPMVNPSTGIPSFYTNQREQGTDVIFLNLYRRYEHLEVHTLPYPIRSVYVQRRIPQHGFIDLKGRLNKPLNKKYFEFWVNGRLMHDEVTIISPTKFVLHGLRSLRNLEIIEVNRDPNEYFSDLFLEMRYDTFGRPHQLWNYETYLDAALEGTLEGDNYTLDEQRQLLEPVFPQVPEEHPSWRDFPPNMDVEDDIIMRILVESDRPEFDVDDNTSQFMLTDYPTLEGIPIIGRRLRPATFGFIPIDDQMIVDMLNEEWAEEIAKDPYLHPHVIISDDVWFGTTARLYDEYGLLVHNLNEAAYTVPDWKTLNINSRRRVSRILHGTKEFDLQ